VAGLAAGLSAVDFMPYITTSSWGPKVFSFFSFAFGASYT
jgi:hypothetical protein